MTEKITKTVGTSTSMTPSSTSTSSPARTPSSSATIERHVISRYLGIFPPYTPDSISATNTSLNDIDPPPYPEDSSFDSQDLPPPYPIDELKFRTDLPHYPFAAYPDAANPDAAYPDLPNYTEPAAPTIIELDDKIDLTPTEREQIMDALSNMRRTVQGNTEIERKEFSDAQRKLEELFTDALPRLTEADKNEFMNEAQRINRMRYENDMERLKGEREVQELEHHAKEVREVRPFIYRDFWSILYKVIQLVSGFLAVSSVIGNSKYLVVFAAVVSCITMLISFRLLRLYLCGRKPAQSKLDETECRYWILCATAYFGTTLLCAPYISNETLIYRCVAFVSYVLDVFRTVCPLKCSEVSVDSLNNSSSNSSVSQIGNNNCQHPPLIELFNDIPNRENVDEIEPNLDSLDIDDYGANTDDYTD